MCGIALIVSGVRFDLPSSAINDSTPQSLHSVSDQQLVFSIDDIEAALRRRGPDSLSTKQLFLQPGISRSPSPEIVSFVDGKEAVQSGECCCHRGGDEGSCGFALANGRTDGLQSYFAELHFFGATLQLRGMSPIVQPFLDSSGNILVYNGEIFGGIHIGSDENDAEVLLRALKECCSCNTHLDKRSCHCDKSGKSSVVDVLSRIRGPWAVIYWQDSSRTLWFGRDAFGRRSLLVHWPTVEDSRFMLSSVSPISSVEQSSDLEAEHGTTSLRFWEELPCGIYSMTVDAPSVDGCLVAEVKKHEWTDAVLKNLIKWERACVEPGPEELHTSRYKTLVAQHGVQSAYSNILPSDSGPIQAPVLVPAETVLISLRESVRRRSSLHTIFQADTCGVEKQLVPVAILFSGGLDSMILAALLNVCLDPRYEIDLLNVSFDGESAPDRISAKAGVKELRRIAPSRKWKLVEIDSDLSTLTFETKHVMSLISPLNTYMDLNIGIALWLAAGGEGWVYEENSHSNYEGYRRVRYRSKARILLVGSGADEQCAGYGRHRTKYRHGSWLGLHEEMKLDMQRIWKRNLGRDDRCIADNGKEARFPFLDEDVIKVLLDIPLWEVTDLDQPSGAGDKKVLREVAQLLGLYEAASLPKRAIQFGSRIARESNRKNFGSNRAANQASAGSVVIHTKLGLN
ncbi:Asparagine synthase family amidotransferase [Trema orientale]|uniref:Asparagine synthase family amidotransferase n=1 Tax=Trema orientale TaxID=63057 RepID=A0A2P5CUB5_TREOI|nr:Asparagine synthase family amidotransferase [Trema orientale]